MLIKGSRQKLRFGRIQYFESNVHKILAIAEQDQVEFYLKMDELEERLPSDVFLRCHQSYIVNRSYVWRLSAEELVLLNQKRIPVSRWYMKEVQKMLQERSRENVR